MADTKERKMTPKGFLHKTTTKAANSAIAFLAQYREYLTTGELALKTSPIIAQVDAGELLPTPALKEIQYAVMTHIIESDTAKAEKSMDETARVGTRKPWRTTIYNAAGEVQTRVTEKGEVEDLIKGFDLGQRANEWADRRLFDGASDWYAMVEHTVLANVQTRIERSDSIARILKQPKGPTIQQKGKSTKTLGFGVKAKETRVTFSRG
jgi:hypothetical protein